MRFDKMALFYFRGGEFDWLNEWANQNERANQNVLINAKDF